MPSGRIVWLLVLALFQLFLSESVQSYDINTCWQQCFDSPPAIRALNRNEPQSRDVKDHRRRKGRHVSSSSSSSSSSSDSAKSGSSDSSDSNDSSKSSESSSSSNERDDNYITGDRTFSLINQLGLEARKLRERYGSEAVNFLLDNSLSHKHNLSSEAAKIWRQQKDIVFILAVMMELGDDGIGSGNIIPFDQSFAWSCDGLTCLDACQMGAVLMYLDNIQTTWDSGRRGDIQAACSLGNYNLQKNTNATCAKASNPMAVAVANSDLEQNFHLTRRSKRRYRDQTDLSCGSYQARYLVGTHSSGDSDQKYWASRSARSRYVPDDWQTMAAVEGLSDCMWSSCCDQSIFVPPPTNCIKADGYQGENIEPYKPT